MCVETTVKAIVARLTDGDDKPIPGAGAARGRKGDDRGKFYRVFDYRQRDAYQMADSQHMCGGA